MSFAYMTNHRERTNEKGWKGPLPFLSRFLTIGIENFDMDSRLYFSSVRGEHGTGIVDLIDVPRLLDSHANLESHEPGRI